MTTPTRRPEIFKLLVKVPDGLPTAPAIDSFLVEMNAPDPLGPTREEIVAAVDEATLPGERILDEKWSEYDWGATGLSSLIIEIVAAYAVGKGLDVFLEWIKSNMEATWEKVETEADAVSRSIDHLKQVHNLDEVDIESSTELSPGTWELVVRSGRFTFDVLVKSEHFLLVKAQRREREGY